MIRNFPSRKDNIILAAIDIIDEKGIQGLSTKEIALKQGISESVLYKHFKSLDDVLIAVVDYYSQYDDAIINTVLKRDIPNKDKILEAIKALVQLYESYPALASITLNYETLMNYDHTKEMTRNIFEKRLSFLEHVFKMGQNSEEFDDFFTPKELAIVIMGTFRSMIMDWKVNQFNFPIKEQAILVIEKVLDKA